MILKKPYGLLIKHFKLIHIILAALTILISIQTKPVVDFFSDYIANNYSVTVMENMASSYISPIIYVDLILVLVMLIALFILLKYKNKPNKFYMASIAYYSILFIAICIAAFLIGSLESGFWETASARSYRDFSQLVYWPQFIIIIVLCTRALGFNVKKFNFQNDIKDLELSEKDSELVELNIGFDTTKTKRNLRRFIREFKYYFKENRFIIIVICVLFIALGGYFIFKNYEKLDYQYNQGNIFNYSNFKWNIEDSIITNLNYAGERMDNNYFLLIKATVTNNNKEAKELDYNNLKVYMDEKYYSPSLEQGTYFIDYAKPYAGEKINAGETKTILIPYSIEKENINNNFNVTIYTGQAIKKKGMSKTISVKLNPIIIDSVGIVGSANIGDTITFDDTYLNNTTLTIKDYFIGQKYTYKYERCYDNKCITYDNFKTADYSLQNKQTLLVLDYDFNLDETSSYYGSYRSAQSFLSHFAKVRFELDGELRVVGIKNVTPANLKNKVILQTTSDIEKAEKVELFITIRNKSYTVNLK